MGGAVIGAGGAAALGVHFQVHRIAGRETAFGDAHDMNMQRAQLFLGVRHLPLGPGRSDMTNIAGLAAGFAIERCLVGENFHRFAGARRHHPAAILEDCQDLAFGFLGVVT